MGNTGNTVGDSCRRQREPLGPPAGADVSLTVVLAAPGTRSTPKERDLTVDRQVQDRQQWQWERAFAGRPERYGRTPSAPAQAAYCWFMKEGHQSVLELGAGQGRDTLFFARAGLRVTALDYARSALDALATAAAEAELGGLVELLQHDARTPLPLGDARFDACYAHMLLCMALTTAELERLVTEIRRVLRPGGVVIYTVRSTADPDFGTGSDYGDSMYEDEGFIVHFFDRALVERLAQGFTLLDVTEFEEGDLPRRLFRVTMRRP